MTEAEGRAAIVAEAMTWLKTPYHHRAKLKGIGVDCAQFVLAVYANVGLIDDFDTGEYPQDWHIHRDVERYLKIVLKFGAAVPLEAAKPGDVILFKIGRVYSHGSIMTAPGQVIHAFQKAGMVCLGDFERDPDLVGKEAMAFSYWAGDVG